MRGREKEESKDGQGEGRYLFESRLLGPEGTLLRYFAVHDAWGMQEV